MHGAAGPRTITKGWHGGAMDGTASGLHVQVADVHALGEGRALFGHLHIGGTPFVTVEEFATRQARFGVLALLSLR
eukprot:2871690-Amphidinium_carterae.1